MRHQRLLESANAAKQEDHVEKEESSSEEDNAVKMPSFADALDDMDSDSDASTTSNDEIDAEPKYTIASDVKRNSASVSKIGGIDKKVAEESVKGGEDEDMELLDNIINEMNESTHEKNSPEADDDICFCIEDPKMLDLDFATKSKYGKLNKILLKEDTRGNNRHNIRSSVKRPVSKTYIFGNPNEDWVKPPAYIQGRLVV